MKNPACGENYMKFAVSVPLCSSTDYLIPIQSPVADGAGGSKRRTLESPYGIRMAVECEMHGL